MTLTPLLSGEENSTGQRLSERKKNLILSVSDVLNPARSPEQHRESQTREEMGEGGGKEQNERSAN